MASKIIERLQSDQPERKVEVDIASNLICKADPNMMDIVLTNLLGNAWKYTGNRELAHIEFGQEIQEGTRAFYVKDNGAGFSKEHADKLFQAFHRLHKDSDFKGTGIGLATVKRILDRQGGKIWAESEEGIGTTFFFSVGD